MLFSGRLIESNAPLCEFGRRMQVYKSEQFTLILPHIIAFELCVLRLNTPNVPRFLSLLSRCHTKHLLNPGDHFLRRKWHKVLYSASSSCIFHYSEKNQCSFTQFLESIQIESIKIKKERTAE